MLPNYLLNLDENIKIFGVNQLLKKVHLMHKKKILPKIKSKVHVSTYYYWLDGTSPIPIKYIKLLAKYNSSLVNRIYKISSIEYSVGRKRCKLPKVMSSELAYLIGALHGDGSLNKNKKYITITTELSPYLRSIIKPVIKELFGIDSQIRIMKPDSYMRLTTGSKVVHSFLSLFCPVGKKKGLLKIPRGVYQNDKLLKNYLSGLFDTDGCLTHTEKNRKQLYFVFVQSDKKFVYQVYKALNKLGIKTNEPRKFKSPPIHYANGRSLIEWRLYIGSKSGLNILLNKIRFKHPLKKKRRKDILKIINGPGEDRTLDSGAFS